MSLPTSLYPLTLENLCGQNQSYLVVSFYVVSILGCVLVVCVLTLFRVCERKGDQEFLIVTLDLVKGHDQVNHSEKELFLIPLTLKETHKKINLGLFYRIILAEILVDILYDVYMGL